MQKKRMRNFTTKSFSLTGQIFSVKNNDLIKFESSLERDAIMLFEYDLEVDKYWEQPITIKYAENGKKRRYTPDFFVKYEEKQRKSELIEVKYFDELIKKEDDLRSKFYIANKFCKNNNLKFRVITERDMPKILINNYKFLWRFENRVQNIQFEDISLIISIVEEKNKIKIDDLLRILSSNKIKQGEYLYVIWYMVSIYILKCDLNKPLNKKSVLWK